MAATAMTAILDGGSVTPGTMPGATANRSQATDAAVA